MGHSGVTVRVPAFYLLRAKGLGIKSWSPFFFYHLVKSARKINPKCSRQNIESIFYPECLDVPTWRCGHWYLWRVFVFWVFTNFYLFVISESWRWLLKRVASSNLNKKNLYCFIWFFEDLVNVQGVLLIPGQVFGNHSSFFANTFTAIGTNLPLRADLKIYNFNVIQV